MIPFIPIIMAAGAAMSAMGQMKQGKAAKAAADYNAQIAEQNAALARQEAADNVKLFERQQYLLAGAIRANQGASGGRQQGSVLDVLADAAAQGELEKQMILYRGELKARGYENTAALDEYGGQVAKTGSYFKAGAELLGGAANTYSAYGRLTRTN